MLIPESYQYVNVVLIFLACLLVCNFVHRVLNRPREEPKEAPSEESQVDYNQKVREFYFLLRYLKMRSFAANATGGEFSGQRCTSGSCLECNFKDTCPISFLLRFILLGIYDGCMGINYEFEKNKVLYMAQVDAAKHKLDMS